MKWIHPVMLVLLAGCAAGGWKDFYGDAQSASIPRDVRSFVTRTQGCTHFSGEEPYDAERRAFLEKNITELCTGLAEEKAALRAKYASNAEALALMQANWDNFRDDWDMP